MAPPRPRLLYSAVFAWLSVTGGRFFAPFLEHEASFSDEIVGSVLATQCAVSALLGSAGGTWADARERRFPGQGRAQVMFIGVSVGSISFLLEGVHHLLPLSLFITPEWHFVLRIAWASSLSLVMPVLDGMTLAHLEKAEGMETSDYGKERLFGAISWAITNLLIGPLADYFGFAILYPFGAIVTVILLISIAVYVQGQQCIGGVESHHNTCIELVQDDSPTKDHHLQQLPPPQVPTWALFRILVGTVYGAGFFFAMCCLSSGTSVVESLVFLFFEFLGGSNTMCGITVALTVMIEIPIFHVAPWLLHKVGAGMLLQIASASYIVRVVGYTLIPKGHMSLVLLLEPLHGVTYACAKTSSVDFVAQLVPKGCEASGQGLLGLFQGIGSVAGLFFGGVLEEQLGPRIMYRIFALIVLVGMSVFSLTSLHKPQRPQHVVLRQSVSEISWGSLESGQDDSDVASIIELVPPETK